MFNSDSFLTILKTSDSVDELQAVKEKIDVEIAKQRSRDTGGDDGNLAAVVNCREGNIDLIKLTC